MSPQVRYEETENALIIGSEKGKARVALSVEYDADAEHVEDALKAAYQELRHTARVREGLNR